MTGNKITRLLVASTSHGDDIPAIIERFEGLPSLCTKDGEKYIAGVRARQTIDKYDHRASNSSQNLVIEIDFNSEEDFDFFVEKDEIHHAAAKWAKAKASTLDRLTVRS